MSKRTKMIAIGTSLAIAAGGAGVAVAAGGTEDQAEGPDVAITGSTLDKAEAAALEATGQGEVTGTETGDEESYYEVEVTLDDGSQVDVQLDRDLNVVDQMADSENDE
ncbi:MAG: hypothetical protein QOI31_492 [Solirubrobacterales bacterium]|jgi:uncharacterized membrane protein YkoI|nr:hypothetical protein [Solirubrobacterales bacterium]